MCLELIEHSPEERKQALCWYRTSWRIGSLKDPKDEENPGMQRYRGKQLLKKEISYKTSEHGLWKENQ